MNTSYDPYLVDHAPVGIQFRGGADLDGGVDVLEGCECVTHLEIDDGSTL